MAPGLGTDMAQIQWDWILYSFQVLFKKKNMRLQI